MRAFCVLASVLGLAFLAGCVVDANPYAEEASKDFLQTRAENDVETLSIDWPVGDVTIVVNTDATEVTISGTITAFADTPEDAETNLEEFEFELLESTTDADNVTLSVTGPTDQDWYGGATLEIELPQGVVLDVEIGTGDLSITGNTENIDISLDNGDVVLTEIEGDIDIVLDTGDIDLETVEGDVDITHSSGDEVIDDLAGNLEIDGGNVDVIASVTPPEDGTVAIDVVTGDIGMTIPMDFGGELDLETTLGTLGGSTDGFVLTNTVAEPNWTAPTHISATMNGGGGSVTAATTLGDITIMGM